MPHALELPSSDSSSLEFLKDAFCVTYANDEKHAHLLLCRRIGVGNEPRGHLEFVWCIWVCAVSFICEREEKNQARRKCKGISQAVALFYESNWGIYSSPWLY